MKLDIKNIGIIEEASVALDGLTVIAGENDTGKSTVGKLMFAVIKAMSRYEEDLELSKEQKVSKLIERLYVEVRKNSKTNTDYRNARRFHPSLFNDLFGFRKNSRQLTLFEEGKNTSIADEILHYYKKMISDSPAFNTSNKVNKIIKSLEDELLIIESKEEILAKACQRAFVSEFYSELNSKKTRKKATVLCSVGKRDLFLMELKNDEISKFKLNDDIPPFDDVTFIESPIIMHLVEAIEHSETLFEIENIEDKTEFISRFSKPKVTLHIKDFVSKLKGANYLLEDEFDSHLRSIHREITNIANGDFYFDKRKKDFIYVKGNSQNSEKVNIRSINTASGIKSFGIIQLLLHAEIVDESSLLVIDEPETHLHPKWQVEYARLLVELVKNDITVLVTSHSPYIIQALKYYSEEAKLYNKTNFYLSEKQENGMAKIEDVTDDLSKIFFKLSKPLQKLVWE